MSNPIIHTPVLFQEVMQSCPDDAHYVMDGTLWHGWHTLWFLAQWRTVLGVDRDQAMIAKARQTIDQQYFDENRIQIVHGSYADFEHIKQQTGVQQVDYILIDIGVNMEHFKDASRGFSIKHDGPLDMRYDTSQWQPVALWLAQATYQDLVDNLVEYADFSEKYIDWIAKELVQHKKSHPFHTTHDVRDCAKNLGINDKKLAVIFQSWRIQINNELDEFDRFLETFVDYLRPWWRCCIITYHSGEDRRAKIALKSLAKQNIWIILTKHVIKPSWQEIQVNKAARSAKMRLFEKI